MIDYVLQAIVSNLIVASLLAVFAWQVQRWTRSASLANLLWALVLIKIMTPPLFSLPILEVPSLETSAAVVIDSSQQHPEIGFENSSSIASVDVLQTDNVEPNEPGSSVASVATFAMPVWIAISTILFLVSLFRIVRFHLMLLENSSFNDSLTKTAAEVAFEFRLAQHPRVFETTANIAPFVWWVAGRAVIVVSKHAIENLTNRDLRLIIAHEMAHIKRRDHMFRWLEWFSVIAFWWNPIMWWARLQLRRSEELACDDLVLQTSATEVHQYANSLINMAEVLSTPAIRPPVLASAINSGGILEKRLKKMINKNNWKVPTTLRLAVILIASFIFPLGIVYANQDFDAVERRLGGAVEAGEISLEQAKVMLEALRQYDVQREMKAKKKRDYTQLESDIVAAVAAGDLSKAEADRKLIEERRAMYKEVPIDLSKDLPWWIEREANERQRELKAIDIEKAVVEGVITPDEAKEKLERLYVEKIRRNEHEDPNVTKMEQRKRRYSQFAAELEKVVDAGKITQEDAELKLAEMRKRMDDSVRDDLLLENMAVRKQRYLKLTEELKAAAEAGKMTPEQVEKKLFEIRRKMLGEKREPSDRDDAGKQKFIQVARDVEAALKAGDLSQEEARRRLIEIKEKIADVENANQAERVKKREYLEIQRAIKEAVKTGDLSKAAAEMKLIELKKEMDAKADNDKSFK